MTKKQKRAKSPRVGKYTQPENVTNRLSKTRKIGTAIIYTAPRGKYVGKFPSNLPNICLEARARGLAGQDLLIEVWNCLPDANLAEIKDFLEKRHPNDYYLIDWKQAFSRKNSFLP